MLNVLSFSSFSVKSNTSLVFSLQWLQAGGPVPADLRGCGTIFHRADRFALVGVGLAGGLVCMRGPGQA